jgi:putative ABC transport system permease protein
MSLLQTLRSLARVPRLSAAVVVTIALGVAALTATFGIMNAALFRQPPFPKASRLTMLYLERNPRSEAPYRERWSFARFMLLRERQQSFEAVASYSPSALTLSDEAGTEAELLQGERVSPSYFRVLGVTPERGRLFAEAENDPGAPSPVAVIGHRLWLRRFGGRTELIGQTIRLNGVPLTVIGILPAGFRGLSDQAELWVPATMTPQLTYAEYVTTNQNFISVVGRLKDGVAHSAAAGELTVLGAAINREIPSDPDYPDERVTASAVSLNEARVGPSLRTSLFVLIGAVGLLHLLAAANVTNLLLGRAAARRRESAVRVALGSSTGRLFRHILAEGMVLTAAGGVLGIALAAWISAIVVPPANVWAPRNFYGSLAAFDAPAFSAAELGFGLALAVLTALLVSVPPALAAFRIDVGTGVKSASRGMAQGGSVSLRRPTARGLIVGIETAIAMLLVVTAGLLIESFQRMRQVGIGVEPDNVLTFWVIPSEARVPPEAAPAFVSRVLDAVTRIPGVVSASVDGGAPLSGTASSTLFIEGRPAPAPGQAPPVLRHYIGPDHFRTLGIPLRRGRAFTAGDVDGAPRVTVISESAAEQFWPGEDPIGRRVWFSAGAFDSQERSAEVVGVVGDVVYRPLDQRPNFASFYTPYQQFTYASRMVFLQTSGEPMAVAQDARRAIATVDPELAIREAQPLSELVRGSWARNRFDALLFGGFGIAALVLAASGIFAVLAYAVATRTREFGIRIALGANPARVIRTVLREGLMFPVVGLVAGIAASAAFTRVLRSSLYGISPLEPRVFVGMAALLLAVAAVACLGPAWRATRADPIEALRSE